MNDLAMLETALGEKFDGQLYLKNALQLAREANYEDEILICLKNLAGTKLDGREWIEAENLARAGLSRTQEIGCDRLLDLFADQLAKSLKRDAISVSRVGQPKKPDPF